MADTNASNRANRDFFGSWTIIKPLESPCDPLVEVWDRSGCKLDVFHDQVRHTFGEEKVMSCGDTWRIMVTVCKSGNVLLRFVLR